MAPVNKVSPKPKVSPPAAAPSAKPASAAKPKQKCPFAEIYRKFYAWNYKLKDKTRWEALLKLADRTGTCSITTRKGKKGDVAIYDAVLRGFLKKFNQLSPKKSASLVTQLVKFIGPTVSKFHDEVLITVITDGKKEVRDAIETALLEIPQDKLNSGDVNVEFYKKCLDALAEAHKQECDTDESCLNSHAKLFEQHRRFQDLTGVSVGPCYQAFLNFAGEPLSQSNSCVQVSFGLLSREKAGGVRSFVGGSFITTPGQSGMVGTRLGGRGKFYGGSIEAGYLWLGAKDNTRHDIPIELNDPPVNAAGTAYRMRPIDSKRILHAAYFMLNVEGVMPIPKVSWLSLYWGANSGVFAGAVSDDPCSFSYNPSGGSVEVEPEGTVKTMGRLDNRCRTGEFTIGAMFGINAGVRAEF